ncbi:MAG: DNA primase [Bacilli bacterium]|nr:DNA primase [Bacilli bacterium]
MAFLDDSEVEAIRTNANIVDIISDYLPLTQKGKNFFGVCPFHDDHSPSMSVSSEKQIYKCFSCGAAGNVFTFVQNYENISFIDSVRMVAEKIGYNIVIEETKKPVKNANLYKAMELSEMFFKNNLNTSSGIHAKKYLEERNINENIISEFNIGLSLPEKKSLYNLLEKKGFSNSDLRKIGLINIDGVDIYDTFVNRIMFPIHNLDGQVVGFTGRIYNSDSDTKYYNSKESDIFKKGQILFNYHRAKDFIKEKRELIIVEGNMDAIRMYSMGFKNTVALMGTNLTKDHIEIIKKLRSKVILLLDNDDAGEIATLNNGQALENNNIETFVVRLSDYKDPDDYLVYKGSDQMNNAIKDKKSFMEFKMFYYQKNRNLNNTTDLVSFVKEMLNSVKNTNDNLIKEITIKKLSEEYDIPIEVLRNEISLEETKENKNNNIDLVKTNNRLKSKYDKICEAIIFYLINDPYYIRIYKSENIFIDNRNYRNIINEILYFFEKYNNINVALFISYISNKEDINSVVLKIIGSCEEELTEQNFKKYIKAVKEINIKSKIEKIKEEMKTTLDINKKTELANKLMELKKGSVRNERN